MPTWPISNPRAWLPNAVTVVASEGTPYVVFFADESAAGGTLWAYRYSGGTIGALVATKAGVGFSTPQDWCVISYSPLVVVFRDHSGASSSLWVWNVTANTVAHASGFIAASHDISGMSYGADGYAYLIASRYSTDSYKLHRVSAAGAVTQVGGGTSNTLAAPLNGSPNNACIFDGTGLAFLTVMGSPTPTVDSGIVLVGGAQPEFAPSTTAFPGDPESEWAGWFGGSVLSAWSEAVAWNPSTSSVIYGLWSEPNSEAFVDPWPTSQPTYLVPNAAGDGYLIDMGDRLAVVPAGEVAYASIVWDEIPTGVGPTFTYAYAVPVGAL